jgi:hypothetical protein
MRGPKNRPPYTKTGPLTYSQRAFTDQSALRQASSAPGRHVLSSMALAYCTHVLTFMAACVYLDVDGRTILDLHYHIRVNEICTCMDRELGKLENHDNIVASIVCLKHFHPLYSSRYDRVSNWPCHRYYFTVMTPLL